MACGFKIDLFYNNIWKKDKKYGNNAGIVSAEKTNVFLFINNYYMQIKKKCKYYFRNLLQK